MKKAIIVSFLALATAGLYVAWMIVSDFEEYGDGLFEVGNYDY